jgi:hypothetical protein
MLWMKPPGLGELLGVHVEGVLGDQVHGVPAGTCAIGGTDAVVRSGTGVDRRDVGVTAAVVCAAASKPEDDVAVSGISEGVTVEGFEAFGGTPAEVAVPTDPHPATNNTPAAAAVPMSR